MEITKGTWIRTIVLVLALINNVLALFGKSPLPIEEEQVTELVSMVITIIASLVAWWKNNSFTMAARLGDATMRQHKQSRRFYKSQSSR